MEDAIEQAGKCSIDFGIQIEPLPQCAEVIRLLKLHGSFGWSDTLPIRREQTADTTLWIPPGINKAKQAYPFNALWGLAREMLSCDVLRIIGCRLGANDWDLISLLFAMRHVSSVSTPQIEVIDAPLLVDALKGSYPYLELQSILDVEPVGSQLVADFTGWQPQPFATLTEEQQQQALKSAGLDRNWFDIWLRAKVESLVIDLGDVSTDTGLVEAFLTA